MDDILVHKDKFFCSITVYKKPLLIMEIDCYFRGDKFDLTEFHNVVLKNGAVPLSILEEIIDDYIASAKS